MNIELLAGRPREISVTEPLTQAYDHMKRVLFNPFDLGKWFAVGFCAWLAGLGESGGGGFNYNNGTFSNNNGQPMEQWRHGYSVAREYFVLNMVWLVPVAALVALILLGLGILMLWLNCRGKFMFLHCVALNRAEIEASWDKYGGAANSLFWVRLVLCLAGLVLVLPVIILMIILVVRMVTNGDAVVPLIFAVAGLGMGLFFLFVILALVHKFLADFVVPIMYLRGGSCLAACREFLGLLGGHLGWFILYVAVQIVLAIVLGALVLLFFVLTCCMACCVSLIPYIGTVLLLPLLVFKRSYSLYFLANFGPQYDVFPPAAPLATIPAAGLQPL